MEVAQTEGVVVEAPVEVAEPAHAQHVAVTTSPTEVVQAPVEVAHGGFSWHNFTSGGC